MDFTRNEIISMLSAEGARAEARLAHAHDVRVAAAGRHVYLRGLVEYSNRCRKNCFYCGIRRGMAGLQRYTLTRRQVLSAATEAMRRGYGSVVIQAGELTSARHIAAIENIVRDIMRITPASAGVPDQTARGWDQSLGITLSLGEQSLDAYRRWVDAGATRYLLRMEASDPALYASLHPSDGRHRYAERARAIADLRRAGFMVGTGVMIGLPGQTVENLADDLLFMRREGIDMCGMGPFIPCTGTPLADSEVPPVGWRVNMTLRMIAVLRLMMPDINIAAATALETLHPEGRLIALRSGANVAMPNLTPVAEGSDYRLYDNKPAPGGLDTALLDFKPGAKGDPLHFEKILKKSQQ